MESAMQHLNLKQGMSIATKKNVCRKLPIHVVITTITIITKKTDCKTKVLQSVFVLKFIVEHDFFHRPEG